MTNFEYFKNDVKELLSSERDLSVYEGKPAICDLTDCDKCDFAESISCGHDFVKWLYEEHIEKPKLTKKERMFCELVNENCWIARDKNGRLYVYYEVEPKKVLGIWESSIYPACHIYQEVYKGVNFPFITWEDKEPWSVEKLLALEVEE